MGAIRGRGTNLSNLDVVVGLHMLVPLLSSLVLGCDTNGARAAPKRRELGCGGDKRSRMDALPRPGRSQFRAGVSARPDRLETIDLGCLARLRS